MGRCYNTAVIPAPIDRVWDAIADFHEMGWATGVINKLAAAGDVPGTQPGAMRILNDAIHETLTGIDEDNYTFTYTIDDGPGPLSKDAVKKYVAQVRLFSVTDEDATFIEWQSSYESGDDAVSALCSPIYHALLQALKARFSG